MYGLDLAASESLNLSNHGQSNGDWPSGDQLVITMTMTSNVVIMTNRNGREQDH